MDNAARQTDGGGLKDILNQITGGQAGGTSVGGILGGLMDLAKRAADSPSREIKANNPAAIGGLGAIAGALLGGGKGAVGGGLMAVLGSLAYAAIQDRGASPDHANSDQANPTQADIHRRALLMLRAMIQAAKADGQIDAAEMDRILGKLNEDGNDQEARDFVLQQMRGPSDIAALARDVTSPQDAAEVYAASLMAIEVDSQAERDYLARLASAISLPPPAGERIHAALGVKP